MWCPNCGSYVASGDFCDRCGASLPTSAGPPSGAPARAAPTPRSASAQKASSAAKRAGTLGDLFKTGSPFTGPQPAQKPAQKSDQKPTRSRGQAFLAWRESRRANASAKSDAPPLRTPPTPPPPSRAHPHRGPHTPTPPARAQQSFAVEDPWNDTYGPPSVGGFAAQAQPDPGERDGDSEWSILPHRGPSSAPIAGSSSGWRGRGPMVDLDIEDEEWMGIPQYGQDGAPLPANLRARRAAANLSRMTLNMLLIGVILVILAIPITIGLSRLAALNPQPTPLPQVSGTAVPTAPVPDGFTGYAVPLFSLAYPSAWQHHAADQQLSDGAPLHNDNFTDGQGTTAALYTTAGTADLLASDMDELATLTAVNSPLKPTALGATHTYNGTKWVENDYTFSGVVNGQPVQMQMRVMGAIHGAAAYLFILTAPRSSFNATNSADFEPLLTSFRFD